MKMTLKLKCTSILNYQRRLKNRIRPARQSARTDRRQDSPGERSLVRIFGKGATRGGMINERGIHLLSTAKVSEGWGLPLGPASPYH